MKQARNCSNCARGIKVNVNMDILCRINGIVSRDFVCSRYLKLAWSDMDKKPKCIDCEFFILMQDETEVPNSNGFCQLFTVRCYNGVTKTACSKFCEKLERNIS